MIIEPIKINGIWMATTENPYWGCVTTSLTKSGAQEIRMTSNPDGDGLVPMITPLDDPQLANSKTYSKFYGFISDVSQEELINEINARGIIIPS